jgi:predicted amidophosphoribosyltransferase
MHACTNCKKELTNAGLCVNCQREYDDFCEYLHAKEVQEERWMEVTKEMAIDAGDRSLEGQLIRW